MIFGKARKKRKQELAEQKKREEAAQMKKTLKISSAVFIAILFICSIGSWSEKNTDTADTTSSAVLQIEETESSIEINTPDSIVLEKSSTTETVSETTAVQPTEGTQPSEMPETEIVTAVEATIATISFPALGNTTFDLSSVPAYSGTPYTSINNNTPYFTAEEIAGATISYEYYSPLDSLGRCGVTVASVGTDIMPTEERGSIGQVKPSGWHTIKYDCVDGKYLYNRCHLIGYQLSGENANTSNLITGTRYMNVDGQLPFENMVADYVKETNNHVLYRVTPIFDGNNLVASGVLMEAMSIEDNGDGILFNVYCYNVQPGVEIDYATGDSWLDENENNDDETTTAAVTQPTEVQQTEETSPTSTTASTTYILNMNTKKFHYPSCSSVGQMSEKNKQEYTGSRDDVIAKGYEPCKRCNP